MERAFFSILHGFLVHGRELANAFLQHHVVVRILALVRERHQPGAQKHGCDFIAVRLHILGQPRKLFKARLREFQRNVFPHIVSGKAL